MSEKKQGIYRIYNRANGKSYIGRSLDMYSRYIQHIYQLSKHIHHNSLMQRDWKMYSPDDFVFEILLEVSSMDSTRDVERDFIKKYESQGIYNISNPTNEWNPFIDGKASSDDKRVFNIFEVLEINGMESNIFIPNSIFEDLIFNIKNGSHIAYAYGYLYLSYYLYRNCKYFNVKTILNTNVLKELLGYKEKNRTANYITKRGGLLDKMGYTESTKDYPIFLEETDGKELSFITHKDVEGSVVPQKSFFLKRPVKMAEFTDIEESQSHSIDFEVFNFCMERKELGTVAFYLYSWIKHNEDINEICEVFLKNISEHTGMAQTTVGYYIREMEKYNMVDYQKNENRLKESVFHTNDHEEFIGVDKGNAFKAIQTFG
ncbi:GIY-YIG nuclease family protein [Lederbergia citrisecunda]|uniref:GIY-YIG nuclease family protein n=1 Tax=Lederbergia citrisecunda TaxID=2833583 RepID=UPI003D27E930